MKTSIISIMAATSIVFVSCSNDDKPEVNNREVRFSSGILANQSKVGGSDGNQWEGNEAIGIYMVENGTTNVVEGATNIQYTTNSTGASAIFNSTNPIYYPVDISRKVDFIAYHPYNSEVSNYVYPINLATQNSQSAIDLMTTFANNTGAGYDKTNTSAINLRFRHRLVKVVINVINGAGIPNLDGLTVNIEGMNTTANFDLQNTTGTGGISNESNIAIITPFNAGNNSYEAILLPVILNNTHIVRFVVDGNTYVWAINNNNNSINTLAGSMKYTFNVTIQKENVEVVSTIDIWESGGNSTGIGN